MVACTIPCEIPRQVKHALQIAAADYLRRVDRLLKFFRVARHLFGKGLQIAVERLLQLLHQPLDLRVGRVLCERVLQLLLLPTHLALRQ